MFKLSAEPKFTHKVTVFVPIDGGFKEEHFNATFLVLQTDELTALQNIDQQSETLGKALIGVSEVVDDDGNAVAFSDELRERLIATPYTRIGLLNAYGAALSKARRGN